MGDEVDSVGAGGGGGIGGGRRRGGRGRRERVSQAGLNGFACIQLIMQLLKVTAVYAVISALQNEKETCVEIKSTPERHTDRYRHRETEHDAVQGDLLISLAMTSFHLSQIYRATFKRIDSRVHPTQPMLL